MTWFTHSGTAPIVFVTALCLACSESPPPQAPDPAAAASPPHFQIAIVEEGTGPKPAVTDTVRVHYHGTFPDGRVFDSSVQRGQPASFALNRVIPCWTHALQRVKVGSRVRLICPPEMAYGTEGAGATIPPNATLHFDVELIAIE